MSSTWSYSNGVAIVREEATTVHPVPPAQNDDSYPKDWGTTGHPTEHNELARFSRRLYDRGYRVSLKGGKKRWKLHDESIHGDSILTEAREFVEARLAVRESRIKDRESRPCECSGSHEWSFEAGEFDCEDPRLEEILGLTRVYEFHAKHGGCGWGDLTPLALHRRLAASASTYRPLWAGVE